MREKQLCLVITFHNTMEAIAAEAYLAGRQIVGRMIPVPGAIKAGCGLAWMGPVEMGEQTVQALEQAALGFEGAGAYWV